MRFTVEIRIPLNNIFIILYASYVKLAQHSFRLLCSVILQFRLDYMSTFPIVSNNSCVE